MSDSTKAVPGLLFVYGECGEHVTEKDFNDWYDGEHVPARAVVPGFQTLIRYKQVDGRKPSWLAMYDLSSPDVLQTPAYTGLFAAASDNERTIIANLAMLNRRVYSHISSYPADDADVRPGKYLFIVMIQPAPESEEEFNNWYEEEHVPLLSKSPGWVRSRRYKLIDAVEVAGRANAEETLAPLTYLALHEIESEETRETPEWKHATSTPWRNKVVNELVVGRDARLFELYKVFERLN
ncbi:hypothetical protein PLEOSDRAFT_158547 [Pleurotus ostreatus PC15]|uniref:EthD domain-containing protein n=1 Tax=Pleurotus ostreatus (strain PC15) TaxID=1137138 RepID=A0A067NI87_PLEO1|nr:hypothetical protein PLEOSDRAFT_158547 [Pleurotus ostreatus PC15]